MNILMAASECVPFIKVGGLADVVGTLPKYLQENGNKVKVFLPKYQKIDEKHFKLKSLSYKLAIPIGERFETAFLKTAVSPNGTECYFIENDKYFNRAEVYGTHEGDYHDNRERFIFFSRAVLEGAKAIGFQPDVIHCNDWQTGLIPAYLKTAYSIDGFYINTSTIFTIHNIAYQGVFKEDTIPLAGFSWRDYTWDKLEYYGKVNFLKTALVYADKISTVSPTYAKEILYEEFGRGMEKTLKTRVHDLAGILNGIDYDEWDPSKDKDIIQNFSKADISGKASCKNNLQKIFNFQQDPDCLMFGAVSRLDAQKGFELIKKVIPKFISNKVQFVFLGRGDKKIEKELSNLKTKYPAQVGTHFEFNNPLAHKIYAGCDAFLMPSLFEPCGLGQMIALTYGTIPVVHRTGGLFDTVKDFNDKTCEGNGFSFYPAEEKCFLNALKKAYKIYDDKTIWAKLVANAMRSNFSWEQSAKKYEDLYRSSLRKMV